MKPKKQRILSCEKISINREANYVIEKAQVHDSRVVSLGGLVFFSTQTGDAWILDPEDLFAVCLAQDGERQNFSILETPTKFQIAWEAQYFIDGEGFTVASKDGRVRTIFGYPTREIENTIRKAR